MIVHLPLPHLFTIRRRHTALIFLLRWKIECDLARGLLLNYYTTPRNFKPFSRRESPRLISNFVKKLHRLPSPWPSFPGCRSWGRWEGTTDRAASRKWSRGRPERRGIEGLDWNFGYFWVADIDRNYFSPAGCSLAFFCSNLRWIHPRIRYLLSSVVDSRSDVRDTVLSPNRYYRLEEDLDNVRVDECEHHYAENRGERALKRHSMLLYVFFFRELCFIVPIHFLRPTLFNYVQVELLELYKPKRRAIRAPPTLWQHASSGNREPAISAIWPIVPFMFIALLV